MADYLPTLTPRETFAHYFWGLGYDIAEKMGLLIWRLRLRFLLARLWVWVRIPANRITRLWRRRMINLVCKRFHFSEFVVSVSTGTATGAFPVT